MYNIFLFQCCIKFVIACKICEISQILTYLPAFLYMFLKSCILMCKDGPQDQNMQHPLTKLIKFTVVGSGTYVNILSTFIVLYCVSLKIIMATKFRHIHFREFSNIPPTSRIGTVDWYVKHKHRHICNVHVVCHRLWRSQCSRCILHIMDTCQQQ
jgi:hypothetical protein